MLRPWLVVALFLVLLSGCSTGPEAEEAVRSPTATMTSTAPVAVRLTDTLHLLAPPHMAGELPDGGSLIRTYVPSDLDNLDAGGAVVPAWRLPRPDLETLMLDLTLWVDVQGTVSNPPRPAISGAAPFVRLHNCFWTLDLAIEHADGSRTGLSGRCFTEPEVVPTGPRILEFEQAVVPEVPLALGDSLVVSLSTYGAYGPDSTVEVLSGVPEHDSTLTIERLQLPVKTQTLLL